MVKIFTMKAVFIGDDMPFKNAHYLNPKDLLSDQGIKLRKQGYHQQMIWGDDSESKKNGDFISFTGSGILSSGDVIASIKPFTPNNVINSVSINGLDVYALIQPNNYPKESNNMEHVFMMFHRYKNLLVTQVFKDFWESRGFTGAEFVKVDEIDENRFIKVEN